MSLDNALRALFGGAPAIIEARHLDHLACTLTPHHVELLLTAGGGEWLQLLERICEHMAIAKASKDPGEDVRNREQPKASA